MSFIHDRRECLTGCQEHRPWSPRTDLQFDFIMVYGVNDHMRERIQAYWEHGYVVALMAGCAWGDYQDYLDGAWDGRKHWEESQCDRYGEPIMHGAGSPYLCPAPSFSRYLLEKLKPAVDAGVEAIYLEEPEFWDAAGYSPAFRSAWRAYYGETWQPPHSSCENHFRASGLKAHLYRRLLSEVFSGLKSYAKSQGRNLACYVATHSLINYSQWKIMSPESAMAREPVVDGFIAQVWTGTARAGNVYQGLYTERVFENAFLEYGILRELARDPGRRIWLLHDPVEDNPEYTWESFRDNYLATVVASLMVPDVFRYEVAPWPDRIFNGVYPKKGCIGHGGLQPGQEMEGAKPIPASYAEQICTLIQTLGDMNQPDSGFLSDGADVPRIGLMMSDTALFQRSFPDTVSHAEEGAEGMNRILFSLKERQQKGENVQSEHRELMQRIAEDPRLMHDYIASGAFPHFFGLAMPLVKAGIPLRPVQMENLLRSPDTLSSCSALILSYEWMKPGDPREHSLLASWVRNGGTLLIVGDGSDPYHAIRGWWNTAGNSFDHPTQHLYEALGIGRDPKEAVYAVGAGKVVILPLSPARLTLSSAAAARWLDLVLKHACPGFEPRSAMVMKRGPYRIAAVMTETNWSRPLVLEGCYADLFSSDYEIVTKKTVLPGETALLFDLNEPVLETLRPIASTARIESLTAGDAEMIAVCKAAEGIRIKMLLRCPRPIQHVEAEDEDGHAFQAEAWQWNEASRTLFMIFPPCHQRVRIRMSLCR